MWERGNGEESWGGGLVRESAVYNYMILRGSHGAGALADVWRETVITPTFLDTFLSMGPPTRSQSRRPSHLFTCGIPFSLFLITILLIYKV